MLPIEVPPETTFEAFLTRVVPAIHAHLVGEEAPKDAFSIVLRVEGRGDWTIRIRGREMRVVRGDERRPTLWMHATERTADWFLQDAIGPKRFLPRDTPRDASDPVRTPSDPRLIRRIAMASGRVEMVIREDDGGRLAVVFGFGDAARRPIDPGRPDAVAETSLATLERALRGELNPPQAISSGEIQVRGSRLLAMQLALAVAPFCLDRRRNA